MKDIAEFDIDEVCIWIFSIGLGAKTDAFRENAVDGAMLLTLKEDDFAELGLSKLQGKKVLSSVEKTKSMSGGSSDLAAENEALKAKIAQLEAELANLKAASAPPPKPSVSEEPPKPKPSDSGQAKRQERHVLKGATRGAARGVVIGAVAGAIAGDAGKGAKMGVAAGAAGGGMRGLGARRRERLGRRR